MAPNIPVDTTGSVELERFLDFDIPGTRYWWTVELIDLTWQWFTDPSGIPEEVVHRFETNIQLNTRALFPQIQTFNPPSPISQEYRFTTTLDNGLVVLNRDTLRVRWYAFILPNANMWTYSVSLIQASLYGQLHDTRPDPRAY